MSTHVWHSLLVLASVLLAALPGAVGPEGARGGVESLSGSFVQFDPAAGGDECFIPGSPQTFCFTAQSSTTDWEYATGLWVRFPADFTVSDVYVTGTPSCTGSGTFGPFDWSFETTPYEVIVDHPRWHSQTDTCTATYCFDLLTGQGSPGADESWYWDGDDYGQAPHNPCSSDGYTPAGQAACDEASQPPASVPACNTEPDIYLLPTLQSASGCNGVTQTHPLSLFNDTDAAGTFDLSYSVPDGDGALAGPPTVTVEAHQSVPFDVQLTPELCAVPNTSLTARIDAAGYGYTATATIVKTVIPSGTWASVPDSAPPWGLPGDVGDGCTALNAAGQRVTYIIGDNEGIQPVGLWGYNHDTNTWFQPGPGNTPSLRFAADWAYDPDTNLCYLTGGALMPGYTPYNDAYVYDPAANTFATLPDFDTGRSWHDSWVGTVNGVRMLCVGGGFWSGHLHSTQCYDIAAGMWAAENATLGSNPIGVFGAADGVLHAATGDQFWIVAGDQNNDIDDGAYYWDDADNAWHSAGHTGRPRYRVEGDFLDGAFYQVGGTADGYVPSPTVVKGEKVGGAWTWTDFYDLPHARMDNVAVEAGGTLWSIDGDGDTSIDYVDYMQICPVCEVQGWLAGHVADAETGGAEPPCTEAELSVDPGGTVVPVDPVSGAYGPVPLVAGDYTVTVTASGYATETVQVTIVDDVTTTQDFSLYRPAIAVTPSSLSVAGLPGVPVTLALTIADVGHLPLHYRILETPGGGLAPDSAPQSARQTPAAVGLDPLIAEQMALAPDGRATVFVAFGDTADLSAAYGVRDKAARVQTVRDALRNAADRAQANVRAWLDARGIAYHVFYIDNTLSVRADRATLEALGAFPEVSGLRGNHTYQVPPVERPAAAQPDAVIPWDIDRINAPEVWDMGITGEGAIVANVDTGVAYQHEALFPGYLCGSGPHDDCWFDPDGGTTEPYDSMGHGTWTMSLMAAGNAAEFQYAVGAAPGAGWIACQAGPNGSFSEYALNACADWLVFGTPYTPDVVNNSWGNWGTGCDTWYAGKLQAYHAAGILPIFAGHGDGPGCNTDSVPANNPGAFAIGATTQQDTQMLTSGTGPGSCPGKLQYPDMVAPGEDVCVADIGGGYSCDLSGTSFSAPLGAGCVALVKSAAPWLSGDQIGQVLLDTAYDIYNSDCGAPQPDPNYRYGDGRLDCLAAVQAAAGWDLPWVWEEPVSATLPPASGLAVSVTFQCAITDVGHILTGTLRIEHDDPCPGPVEVPLELTCTEVVAPDIELSVSSLDHVLCPGALGTTALDVCNMGTGPLNWTMYELSATLRLADVPWLSEEPVTGTVTPGNCQAVAVTFDAAATPPGEHRAGLHVASNDPDEPDVGLPVTMTVIPGVSGAGFDWSPPVPAVGETVYLSATVAAGAPPLAFAWDFDDGGTAAGQYVTHTYAAGGAYTVTLTATNTCGQETVRHGLSVGAPALNYVYLPLVCKTGSRGGGQ